MKNNDAIRTAVAVYLAIGGGDGGNRGKQTDELRAWPKVSVLVGKERNGEEIRLRHILDFIYLWTCGVGQRRQTGEGSWTETPRGNKKWGRGSLDELASCE